MVGGTEFDFVIVTVLDPVLAGVFEITELTGAAIDVCCSDLVGAHSCAAGEAAGGATVDCRLLDKVLATELLLSPSPPGGAMDWRRL